MENFDPLKWLAKNKDIVSFHQIEKILAIPQSTIHKAVSGERDLPDKHAERLRPFLIDRFKIQ